MFKMSKIILTASILANITMLHASGGSTISNGTINVGVNDEGNLIVGSTGIQYIPSGSKDALAPGCDCEGWGVADGVLNRFGKAGQEFGYENMVKESYNSTATSAISIVKITDKSGDFLRVTHDFKPSTSPNLYQVDVTIENISGVDLTDLRYRRAMDWDVPPTEYKEMSTIVTGGSPKVLFSSDDGFADGNPLTPPSSINFTGEAKDNGPADHGALFDFGFGKLANGDSFNFTIFYGAADNETDALNALSSVKAENVYSLGKANPSDPRVTADGAPNTFVFGFKGVGGSVIGGGNGNSSSAQAIPSSNNQSILFLVLLLSLLGIKSFRRN